MARSWNPRKVARMHASAFDELAQDYDAAFTDSLVGRALRDIVWARIDANFRNCRRVLELGCGTGEDAVRLATRGTWVVATDVSPQMLEIAREKARSAGCAERIEFHCVAMERLSSAIGERQFDGVLSNFGAVNCVADLPQLVADASKRVVANGKLLWVILGRYVPWEWMWYGFHGTWHKAWRRLTPGGVLWRGLRVSYPVPREMIRLLRPTFEIDRLSPLGFALPPSYAAPWIERSSGAFSLLRRLELWGQPFSALARLSDHYIIEATRR